MRNFREEQLHRISRTILKDVKHLCDNMNGCPNICPLQINDNRCLIDTISDLEELDELITVAFYEFLEGGESE